MWTDTKELLRDMIWLFCLLCVIILSFMATSWQNERQDRMIQTLQREVESIRLTQIND